MSELIEIRSKSENLKGVLDEAAQRVDECDGVVILMQRKKGGILWMAPDAMRLETLIFLLWSALVNFGKL